MDSHNYALRLTVTTMRIRRKSNATNVRPVAVILQKELSGICLSKLRISFKRISRNVRKRAC